MINRSASLFVAATIVAATPGAAQTPRERWIATWATSLFAAPPRPPVDSVDRTPTIINRTLRQIVRVSAGGSRARIRLSNQYGDRPLVIGSAHIALRRADASIDPATDRVLTFNGRSSIVIRPGANLVSDGVALSIPKLSDPSHTRLSSIPGRPPDLVHPPAGCRFAPRCAYARDKCHVEEPPLVQADQPDHVYACWFPVGSPEFQERDADLARVGGIPVGIEGAS